ncbi:MAG: Rha family transcriptional regulator [Pseudanabaena sp.]
MTIDKGTLVCDSRDLANELGINHDNFMQTIETHKAAIQDHFGVILFETGKPQGGTKGGRPVKYCLLTEDQFIFIATLSRNTVKVVEVKAKLVKAFATARRALQSPITASYHVTQVDKNYMANVLKQYTSTVVKKCKQAKTLDDCEAIFLNGLKFAKTYKSIEQKHADIQQEESNLFLDFCMDD